MAVCASKSQFAKCIGYIVVSIAIKALLTTVRYHREKANAPKANKSTDLSTSRLLLRLMSVTWSVCYIHVTDTACMFMAHCECQSTNTHLPKFGRSYRHTSFSKVTSMHSNICWRQCGFCDIMTSALLNLCDGNYRLSADCPLKGDSYE